MPISRYETARDHREFQPGYDVDPNAIRFSNYYHVLREIVHFHNGWLPRVGPYEAKCLLGAHVHDDARQVLEIKLRLKELRHPSEYPGAPSGALRDILDELGAPSMTWQGYLAAVYKVLKPALVKAWRYHLETTDPIIDEPSTRLIELFIRTTEKQIKEGFDLIDDICAEGPEEARIVEDAHQLFLSLEDEIGGELGSSPLEMKSKRVPKPFGKLEDPVRDPGFPITEKGDTFLSERIFVNGPENHVPTEKEELKHYFHGLMDAELTAAELIALNSHENPEMPWLFHVDMARQTWDEIRHAQVLEHALTELGCAWGDYAICFRFFHKIYGRPLLERLILFNRQSEGNAMWRHNRRRNVLMEHGLKKFAQIFDYLLADEVAHVSFGVTWGTHLLGGDKRAFIDKVKELTASAGKTDDSADRKTAGARGFEKADDESEKMVEAALDYLAVD